MMGTLGRMQHAFRKFSTSQILGTETPYRPTPIIPHVKEGDYYFWKKISLLVMLPLVGLVMVKLVMFPEKHTRPKFVPYEHLRLRTKRFAWGDGNHSFFHNKHTNPLPDGYEEEDDCDE